MISRRLLRIKVLQVLYAYYKSDDKDLKKSENELFFSINKAYELYHFLILLIIEVSDYAESRIELARNKRIPTYEDLNPNTRFIDNKIINNLRKNPDFLKYCQNNKISWVNYPEFIKEIYISLVESSFYKDYMISDTQNFTEDRKLIIKIFNDIILPSDSIDQILEEKSIYWNDDLDFVMTMVVKTIKKMKEEESEGFNLPEIFKNEEDREFVLKLFRKSLIHRDISLKLIEEKASNWDLDRIAFMDILIMQMAIAELIEFSSIPTKVTLNEFLEIAKYYSTEKSNSFINGVLDKIMQKLKENKSIKKTGRGLIGEQ
jgi:N utilization substance protein B